MAATTLSDINDTLQQQNGTLNSLSENIGSFIVKINNIQSGKKLDDLEAERESKKIGFGTTVSSMFNRTMDAGKKAVGGISLPSFGLGKFATAGGLAGAVAALGKGLLLRGVPAVALGLLAQEIADYVESETGSKELANAAFRSAKLGGIGLLFGKRFAIIGAAIGAVLTEENQKLLGQIGDKATESLKALGIEIPAMPDILKGVSGTINSALEGINKALSGEMPSANEFSDIALSLGGLAAILAPGATFRMLLKGLGSLSGVASRMIGMGFAKSAGVGLALSKAGAAVLFSPAGLAALIAGSLYFAIKNDDSTPESRKRFTAEAQAGMMGTVDDALSGIPVEVRREQYIEEQRSRRAPIPGLQIVRPMTSSERARAAGMGRGLDRQVLLHSRRSLPSEAIKTLNASSGFAGGGSVVAMDNSDNSVRTYSSTSNQGLVLQPPTPMDRWDPYFPSR